MTVYIASVDSLEDGVGDVRAGRAEGRRMIEDELPSVFRIRCEPLQGTRLGAAQVFGIDTFEKTCGVKRVARTKCKL